MDLRTRRLIDRFNNSRGTIAVLTGAGISAESGIPTFRGPEGYWTVGSKEYRPEEMATQAMFRIDPWEVWSWYLYRRGVCTAARPNAGHRAVAAFESHFGERFRLITQNVDGLHLVAGNTLKRTYEIHGNIQYMRCAQSCSTDLYPVPMEIGPKERGSPVTDEEKLLLVCPKCGSMARPHVLWFDECYDESLFHYESSLQWAAQSNLLLSIGTSGATNLPMQVGMIVSRKNEAVLVDVNTGPNPFRELASRHPNGVVLEGKAGEVLPKLLTFFEQ